MIQNWKFQRGDIFFTRFDNATGSEQSGNRPAVVLQNDVGNFYSPTLIVATLTSKAAKKYTQPTHCLLVNEFLSVPSTDDPDDRSDHRDPDNQKQSRIDTGLASDDDSG